MLKQKLSKRDQRVKLTSGWYFCHSSDTMSCTSSYTTGITLTIILAPKWISLTPEIKLDYVGRCCLSYFTASVHLFKLKPSLIVVCAAIPLTSLSPLKMRNDVNEMKHVVAHSTFFSNFPCHFFTGIDVEEPKWAEPRKDNREFRPF